MHADGDGDEIDDTVIDEDKDEDDDDDDDDVDDDGEVQDNEESDGFGKELLPMRWIPWEVYAMVGDCEIVRKSPSL